jgi:hypothetical protein
MPAKISLSFLHGGILSLTQSAKLSLHIHGRPLIPPPWLQHLDQIGEREQIGHTERGPASSHYHKRIVRDNVGPTGRDLP